MNNILKTNITHLKGLFLIFTQSKYVKMEYSIKVNVDQMYKLHLPVI